MLSLAEPTLLTLTEVAAKAVNDPDLPFDEGQRLIPVLRQGLEFAEAAKGVSRRRGVGELLAPGEWTNKVARLKHLIRILEGFYGPKASS